MPRLGLSEILENTAKQPTVAQQGEYIRANFNPTLGKLIQYAYDPMYVWDLPEGSPPYKPNQFLDQESNLYSETRRLYIFMKGTGDHVPPVKKELNFIQMLENLSKADAELLLEIKEKRLPFGITEQFVREHLPGLLSEPAPQKAAPEPIFQPTLVVDTAQENDVPAKPARTRKSVARKSKPAEA